MDIRLRILRRIMEMGECRKYRIKYETEYSNAFKEPRTDLTVFTGECAGVVLLDSYTKYGVAEETAVFEWLDEWKERFEEARAHETN